MAHDNINCMYYKKRGPESVALGELCVSSWSIYGLKRGIPSQFLLNLIYYYYIFSGGGIPTLNMLMILMN